MSKHLKTFSIIMLAALLVAACGGTGQQNKVLSYTLKTDMRDGKMVYVGVGDGIDGVVNPTLIAAVGDMLQIKLISGDGTQHNINFPEFNTNSANVTGNGNSITVVFGRRFLAARSGKPEAA